MGQKKKSQLRIKQNTISSQVTFTNLDTKSTIDDLLQLGLNKIQYGLDIKTRMKPTSLTIDLTWNNVVTIQFEEECEYCKKTSCCCT